MSRSRRMAMVNRVHPELSVVKQCHLLKLSRSSVYYRRKPTRPADLELMASMDRQYLKTPYYGSRRMTAWLRSTGTPGQPQAGAEADAGSGSGSDLPQAQYQQACAGTQDIPLLAERSGSRQGQSGLGGRHHLPAHVPGVPVSGGHYGLAQPVQCCPGDSPTRWEAGFCINALKEALGKGQPEVFNTDQGSQFTSEAFSGLLLERGIKVSMDGKGRYLDNIFVERLWRSVKYEEVYLKAYRNGSEARRGVDAYLDFYNRERPHQSLGYRTPAQVIASGRPLKCLPEQPSAISSREAVVRHYSGSLS